MSEKDTQRKQTFISHRILSWCGDHKMKVIAIAMLLALASLSGGYLYQEQTPCTDITLELKWASGTPIATETDPTITCYEDEPVQLLITYSTSKGGVLLIAVESQEVGLVSFSKDKDEGYSSTRLELISRTLTGPVDSANPTTEFVWVKAKFNSKGFKDGVYVKATLDESCKKEGHAFLDVKRLITPPPPPCPIQRFINWFKNLCAGTFVIFAIIPFLAVVKRKH